MLYGLTRNQDDLRCISDLREQVYVDVLNSIRETQISWIGFTGECSNLSREVCPCGGGRFLDGAPEGYSQNCYAMSRTVSMVLQRTKGRARDFVGFNHAPDAFSNC
jgi:hypothetical protein